MAPRRLVVVPNDPLEAYVAAGYPDLTSYFNPGRAFDEIYCVSPHERREYELYGIKVLPTPIAAFATRVKELGATCVRAYDIPAGQIACAKRVPGVPVVVSVHDVNAERCPGPLPNADVLPRFPPGSTIQSGTCQSRWSSISMTIDFWPSMRNGLIEFSR